MVWIEEMKRRTYDFWARRSVSHTETVLRPCLPCLLWAGAGRLTLAFEPEAFIFYQEGKS